MELNPVSIRKYISIVNMGLIWRLATPSIADRDKNDGTCYNEDSDSDTDESLASSDEDIDDGLDI